MQRPLDYYGPGENTGIWVTPSAPAVSTCRRADIQTTLGLSLFFTHSCALFCSQRNLNSFLFKWFRTLWGKNTGGGVPLPADPPAQSEGAPTERLHRQTCVRVFSVRRDSWAHFTKDGWTQSQA